MELILTVEDQRNTLESKYQKQYRLSMALEHNQIGKKLKHARTFCDGPKQFPHPLQSRQLSVIIHNTVSVPDKEHSPLRRNTRVLSLAQDHCTPRLRLNSFPQSPATNRNNSRVQVADIDNETSHAPARETCQRRKWQEINCGALESEMNKKKAN